MPAVWEEKRPRTEKVVMAASFRSGGPREEHVNGGGEITLGLVPAILPSDP